jgi:hypothetical protein
MLLMVMGLLSARPSSPTAPVAPSGGSRRRRPRRTRQIDHPDHTHFIGQTHLGPPAAYGWLAANAGRFHFIKRYAWEDWHYERA